jgi:hypothetical protein
MDSGPWPFGFASDRKPISMTPEDDLDYFTRRHLEETTLAQKSIEPVARHAHRKLADLHRAKCREALDAATRKPKLKLPSTG